MNSATFAGRLGQDGVLRTTPKGDQVVGFSLAVDERKGQEKTTLWVECSLWGKRAEALAQYLSKGTVVAVSGQVGLRTYEGRNGHQAQLTLRVSELTLLGGGPRQQGRSEQGYEPRQRDAAPVDAGGFVDDDIPF